jgi:hypothetical protein
MTVTQLVPTVTITSTNPVTQAGATLTTAVTFKVGGLSFTTLPTGECTRKLNGGAATALTSTTIAANTVTGLTAGVDTLVITCTNPTGTSSATLTIN